jgi:hypothetical protein
MKHAKGLPSGTLARKPGRACDWYNGWGPMVYRVLLTAMLVLWPGTASLAVESTYFPLTIVRAEQKTRDRVVYWVVNTPLYHEDPYFEVEVRTPDWQLVAERDPERHETLPEYWKTGTLVDGRMERHHLFLRRANGTEMRFIITHRTRVPRS